MKVTGSVLHNQTRGDVLWKFSVKTSALRFAHRFEVEGGADITEVLERVFRASNHVDDSEIEQVPANVRSLSMGDVVIFDGRAEGYTCEMVGWGLVPGGEVLEAIGRERRGDYTSYLIH